MGAPVASSQEGRYREGRPETSADRSGTPAAEHSCARRCEGPVKVGLLGAGRIGALHAGVLASDPRVREILVGDADPDRAGEVAREVGGEAGRIEAVLDSGPDAVVI